MVFCRKADLYNGFGSWQDLANIGIVGLERNINEYFKLVEQYDEVEHQSLVYYDKHNHSICFESMGPNVCVCGCVCVCVCVLQ